MRRRDGQVPQTSVEAAQQLRQREVCLYTSRRWPSDLMRSFQWRVALAPQVIVKLKAALREAQQREARLEQTRLEVPSTLAISLFHLA